MSKQSLAALRSASFLLFLSMDSAFSFFFHCWRHVFNQSCAIDFNSRFNKSFFNENVTLLKFILIKFDIDEGLTSLSAIYQLLFAF